MYVDIQVQQVLPIYKINNQGLQVAAIVGSWFQLKMTLVWSYAFFWMLFFLSEYKHFTFLDEQLWCLEKKLTMH